MPLTGRELAGRRNSAITDPSISAWPRWDRLVVALRKILARVRAAALAAVRGRVDGGGRLQQQVLELEGLDEIAVPDQRAVAHPHVGEGCEDRADTLDSLSERLAGSEHRGIELHRLLHLEADGGGTAATVGRAQPLESRPRGIPGIGGERPLQAAGLDQLGAAPRRLAPEDDEIEQ